MIVCSVGARPVATARSSIAGLRPSMTARTSFTRWPGVRPARSLTPGSWMPGAARRTGTVAASRGGPAGWRPAPRDGGQRARGSCARSSQDAQPGVLLLGAPAPAREQPRQEAEDDDGQRRGTEPAPRRGQPPAPPRRPQPRPGPRAPPGDGAARPAALRYGGSTASIPWRELRSRGRVASGRSPMTSRPPTGTARELERYAGLFASRTRVMTSSAMRDLMAITERPDVISLAGGLPDTSTFSAELLAKLMSGVAAETAARALQYGPTEGWSDVREAIVDVMAAEGTDVDPQDVLVTTGGQQVIDLVCKAFIDPGDVIVAEAPTYPGAVPAFSAYELDVVQIAMDAEGMRVDELEAALARLDDEGRRPKFIYTVPNFQNPAGVTLSLARRRRLVEIAHARELLVLEDNPYGLLRFDGEALPTLRSLDGGRFVVYLGTFSKILSPGVRLGWAAAPGPVYEKLNLGKQASDLCASSFSQAV